MERAAICHPRWALALRLLVCTLPLLFAGCRKAGGGDGYGGYGASVAPGYGGDDGGDYESEEAYGEYDYDRVAESAPEPAPAMEMSRDAPMAKRSISFGANKSREKSADSSITQTTATPTEAKTEPLDVEPPELDGATAVTNKRQIIYTASMQVSVYDVTHAIEVVENLPSRFGGWLHQRVDNQVVLRVPAARLKEVMAVVAELGVVDYRLLEALDVTAEYTDLESRIRVLEQMQAHLEALLVKAVSVEQALEIRRALDEITLELESARAQMREMAKSIAFSTLVLRLVERGPTNELPTRNDPFPWVDQLGVEATDYR